MSQKLFNLTIYTIELLKIMSNLIAVPFYLEPIRPQRSSSIFDLLDLIKFVGIEAVAYNQLHASNINLY